MADLDLQNIIDKYHLTDKQVQESKQTIINVMLDSKIASEQPLCIVVGGQSGAGKTALINYTTLMSTKREFVVIDNDFFRGFHPMAEEIRRQHPEYYRPATDQLGIGITSDVIAYFMDRHYDVILHQTLRNNRIVDDAMTKFKNAGYTVGVRAFAVPYLESKMSQIERCQAQYEMMGYCRHVDADAHILAAKGLPDTVDYIEKSGKYDFIEIFKRGADISHPDLVYAKLNPDHQQATLAALANCENVSHYDQTFGFTNAKEAVITTRQTETQKCLQTLPQRLDAVIQNGGYEIPGMPAHLDEIIQASQQLKKNANEGEVIRSL